jgi:hypothetical protein
MLQSRRFSKEDGSAALEFITAGVLLLVPLLYLVIVVAAIQGGALAVEGASRQAARVFVQAPTLGEAQSRARVAADFALADFGVNSHAASVGVRCSPHPEKCLTRRAFVTVTVTARIALPLSPPALSVKTPLAIPLTATSTEQVSRFWGAG